MIKAILFDVDGTLVDSSEAHCAFLQRICRAAGYPIPDRNEIRKVFHLSLNDALRTLAQGRTPQEMEQLLERGKTVRYPDELQRVFPHSMEVLKHLSKTFPLAVVTSRRRVGVESYFAVAPIKDCFSTVVAVEDVSNRKPHPEPLLTAVKRLGITCAEAIYVGDSSVDVEAAKAAGMKVIACTNVPGADAYFSSFRELPGIIARFSTDKNNSPSKTL